MLLTEDLVWIECDLINTLLESYFKRLIEDNQASTLCSLSDVCGFFTTECNLIKCVSSQQLHSDLFSSICLPWVLTPIMFYGLAPHD